MLDDETSSTQCRLGQCQMCIEKIAKYKCPRCSLCSCSLSCIQSHKIKSGCDGKRNRVELISKDQMDNLTLLSDYRFLEEIDHKLDDGMRNPLRKWIQRSKETVAELPFHLKKLKLEAKKRGTDVEFMPKHFSMHKENSTRFIFADKTIRWHVKLVFPQADLSFTEESVDENSTIIHLLRKYMEPPNRLDDETQTISSENSDKLCYYQSASYRRVAVLLKSSTGNSEEKFCELFLSKSLKVNFSNKKITEYPVLYVVLRDHLDAYVEESEDTEDLFSQAEKRLKTDLDEVQQLESDVGKKLNLKTPRVKKMDGGLSFFNANSDLSDDSE